MAIISNINDKLTVSDQGKVSFNRIGTSTTTGYTFPSLDGTANQILKTNGDGILSFEDDETGTLYTAGDGINFSGASSTVINADINYISYSGSNNFIVFGSQNNIGTTIPTGSLIAYASPSGTQIIGRGTVGDLPFSNNSGNVTGSGTLNKVARWTATGSNLGDGPITFSGNNSTFAGEISSGDDINCPTKIVIGESASPEVRLKKTNAGTGTVRFQNDGSNTSYIQLDASEDMVYYGGASVDQVFYAGGVLNETKSGANSTFAGDITLGDDLNFTTNGFADISNTGTGAMRFKPSSQTLALTLSGANATFAGMITVNGGGIDIDNDDDIRLRFDNASVFKAGLQVPTTAGDMITGSAINDFAIRSQSNMLFAAGGATERMRITDSGDVGIGTDLPSAKLSINAGAQFINFSGRDTIVQAANDPTNANIYTTQAGVGDFGQLSGSLVLQARTQGTIYRDIIFAGGLGTVASPATQLMTILGQGRVGIGTTNPAQNFVVAEATDQHGIELVPGTLSYIQAYDRATSDYGDLHIDAQKIGFGLDNGAEKVTFLANGNVGIGTTSPNGKLQFENSANTRKIVLYEGANNDYEFYGFGVESQKLIYSVYTNTDDHVFVSGVNSTSRNELMRIEGGGNVGIGTTSPQGKLDIQYDMDVDTGSVLGLTSSQFGQYGNINFSGVLSQGAGAASTSMQGITWQVNNYGGTNYGNQAQLVVGNNGDIGTFMGFFTSNSYGAAPVERMRIASGGNIGIGATNPSYKLQVSGTGYYSSTLTVGGWIQGISSTNMLYSSTSLGTLIQAASTTNTASGTIYFRNSNGVAYHSFNQNTGAITAQGDIIAYGSPSDKRLKENIKPIENALDKAMKLQGVTFNWKEKQNDLLDIKEDIGFIAQDVQKVVPELVRENSDGMLSMRHQGIAPILLEAIKELKQEIEELKNKSCNCNCK